MRSNYRFLFLVLMISLFSFMFREVSADEIHDAVMKRDIEKVRKLIKDKPELLSLKDNEECTPLDVAAARGDTIICRFLISQGADVNASDKYYTPLTRAINNKDYETAKFLISKGADIHGKYSQGQSALHFAAITSNPEFIKYLLLTGADVNEKNQCRATPLHSAASEGNIAIIKLLISRGADISAEDVSGETALHYAVCRGNLEAAKFFVEKGLDINKKSFDSVLRLATRSGNFELVKYLVENGADVNAKTPNGCDVLEFVDNKDIYWYIYENGKDPELFEVSNMIKTGNWNRIKKVLISNRTIQVKYIIPSLIIFLVLAVLYINFIRRKKDLNTNS